MTDTRLPRDMQSRERSERPKSWRPPELLPQIDQDPNYSYRYVRSSTMGTPDPMNISTKFREGWEPVKASEHPEAFVMPDPNSRFKDAIEAGGLILCKTPKQFTEDRDAYYQEQTEQAMASVDNNFMRENDPRMPLFKDKKTKVTFGKGSPS